MDNKKKKVKPIISKMRYTIETPPSLVKDGEPVYGTFNEPFKELNLLDVDKPCKHLPKWMNKFRLTEWEAFELDMEVGTLVCAVYNNMNMMGMGIIVFYNREDDCIYEYRKMTRPKKAKIAKNLLNTVTSIKVKNFEMEISNDFENGLAHFKANVYSKKNGRLIIDVDAKRITPPSIVSIPLGEKKPLYTEKDFFTASGTLTFKDKEYKTSETSVAIIDDHKGYYPYRAHYDWLTGFGQIDDNGVKKYFGFNLTHNQSTNEADYNENVIWIDDNAYPLPPVKFMQDRRNRYARAVTEKNGLVEIGFQVRHIYKMRVHLGIIRIDYFLPFGNVYGYVKNEFGKIYEFNNLTAIGEDKTTRM